MSEGQKSGRISVGIDALEGAKLVEGSKNKDQNVKVSLSCSPLLFNKVSFLAFQMLSDPGPLSQFII